LWLGYLPPTGADPYFSSMHILIENEETMKYLTRENDWSKNPLKGKQFPSGELAFSTARQEVIGKFNIVCYIPETNQFINLKHGKGIRKPEEGYKNES
jgi:hypothetical protein